MIYLKCFLLISCIVLIVNPFSITDDNNTHPGGNEIQEIGSELVLMINSTEVVTFNVIDVPVVCPEGQKPDKNGKCRDVWTNLKRKLLFKIREIHGN